MTEHNLFQEVQEDLERQKMEALWKRYGILILAAAIAIVAATAGYTSWHSWNAKKNEQASANLMTILDATNADTNKEVGDLTDFAAKNKGTTQAVIADLQAAAIAIKGNDTPKAVQIYDAVANDTSATAMFRQFADLKSVEAQMDTGNPESLEKRLQPLLAVNAPWRSTAMEYTGYLALREGNKAKAKQIFSDLSQDASVPHSLSTRASDILRIVGD